MVGKTRSATSVTYKPEALTEYAARVAHYDLAVVVKLLVPS